MTRRFVLSTFRLLGLGFLAPAASAQVALDATVGARSQYVGCSGIRIFDEPVQQGDLWWTLPRYFWADISWSTDFLLRDNFGRELDYGAGWSGKYFGVGAYYFDFSELFSLKSFGDFAEVYGEAYYPVKVSERHVVKPFAKFEYLYSTMKPTDWSGTFTHAGVLHRWTLRDWAAFEHDFRMVYDSGIFGYDSGLVARYAAAHALKLGSGFALKAPIVKLTVPVVGADDRKAAVVFGVDLVYSIALLEAPKK